MLELAIAEAYRPCLRPASFATNPNAKVSIFSSQLRLRPASVLSESTSATSRPWSLRSLIARRKRSDSVISKRTEAPEDVTRRDSMLSPPTEPSRLISTSVSDTSGVWVGSALHTELPELPPFVPLPPQEELKEFDEALQTAIDDLQNLPVIAAHDLALSTLSHLAHVADIAACVATSWPEFWGMLVHAARLLGSVQPIEDAIVKNALVSGLVQVARRWNEEQRTRGRSQSTVELARVVGGALDEVIQARDLSEDGLSATFAQWLCKYRKGREGGQNRATLRILLLNPSPTVLTAIVWALSFDTHLTIHLSILSTLDNHHLSPHLFHDLPSLLQIRLHTTAHPTSAIGTASKDIDVLLLSAACIDGRGDIRSNNVALGTAVCVKTLSQDAKIVVLGSVSNIVAATTEEGVITTSVGNDAQSLEWVPARFVDVYIAEIGVLRISELGRLAKGAGELEKHILGEENG